MYVVAVGAAEVDKWGRGFREVLGTGNSSGRMDRVVDASQVGAWKDTGTDCTLDTETEAYMTTVVEVAHK